MEPIPINAGATTLSGFLDLTQRTITDNFSVMRRKLDDTYKTNIGDLIEKQSQELLSTFPHFSGEMDHVDLTIYDSTYISCLLPKGNFGISIISPEIFSAIQNHRKIYESNLPLLKENTKFLTNLKYNRTVRNRFKTPQLFLANFPELCRYTSLANSPPKITKKSEWLRDWYFKEYGEEKQNLLELVDCLNLIYL